MFIEIVDSLRCPNDHADSWLVASCDEMDQRDIVSGLLGCPVCKAEYPIRDGAVWFDPPAVPPSAPDVPNEDTALRVAAYLELTEPRGFAILEGRWSAHAPLVTAMAPTHLVLLNPNPAVPSQPGISTVFCSRRPPFAPGAARAIALDAASDAETTAALVAVVQQGGRILAPVSIESPSGTTELARDTTHWVAEKGAVAVPVPLTMRRREP